MKRLNSALLGKFLSGKKRTYSTLNLFPIPYYGLNTCCR